MMTVSKDENRFNDKSPNQSIRDLNMPDRPLTELSYAGSSEPSHVPRASQYASGVGILRDPKKSRFRPKHSAGQHSEFVLEDKESENEAGCSVEKATPNKQVEEKESYKTSIANDEWKENYDQIYLYQFEKHLAWKDEIHAHRKE